MTVDVFIRERSEGLVVHDDHVGGSAGLENAQLVREVLRADLCVVLEEHVGHFAPRYIRQAGVQTLDAERSLERLDHIVCPCVGAETDEDTVFRQRQHRADADCVRHIGFGIVDDHRAGVLNKLDFRRVHVDAVAKDGLVAQDAVVVQALDRAAAIVLKRIINVVHALGDVNVIAGTAVVRFNHAVKGLVRDGKQRVSAEHGREHRVFVFLTVGDPVSVFLHGLDALFFAVAVRDLVAQARADTKLFGALADLEQRARNFAERRVMIEDRCDALLDAVDVECVCGGSRALECQLAVHCPPRAVEHLIESSGVIADDRKAAGEGGIDVGVGVDERGHNDVALCVDDLGLRVFRAQRCFFADFYDLCALKDDTAFFVVAFCVGISGNQTTVCK